MSVKINSGQIVTFMGLNGAALGLFSVWIFSCSLACGQKLSSAPEREADARNRPGDWPQWRGQERTGISRQLGLLKNWPADGPSVAWKANGLGQGYSTPSVANGRVLGMGFRGEDEVVWALSESTGQELWSARIGQANRRVDPPGPHSTPTVDQERLYALGVSGDLVCLAVGTGAVLWRKNLVSDFGGQNPEWGYSESPLVDGEKVIVTPGGASARLVALNKMTGTNFWRSPIPDSGGAQYSSAIVATVDEQRQYIQFLHKGVVGVAAEDGRFLWRYEKPANGVANCSTPLCYSNTVFAASAYGTGGGSARLTRNGNTTRVEEVYFTRHMMNHHGGMVLIDGHVYGHSEENLVCLQFISGKVVWRDRRPGKGSIAYADGRLYFRRENGQVFLVEANPKEYVERGRFDQSDRSDQQAWPHPVIANGRLYLRDQDVLLCYDVKQR